MKTHNISIYLPFLFILFVTSCSPTSKKYAANRAAEIGEIFFKGTDSYTEKEKQLKLTYEEASKAYCNWYKKTYGVDRLAKGRHSIIVGQEQKGVSPQEQKGVSPRILTKRKLAWCLLINYCQWLAR